MNFTMHQNRILFWQTAACLITTVCLSGCGGSTSADLPDLVPVEGRVTMNGEPLAGATVTFKPQVSGVNSSVGVTDDDGRYKLRYSRDAGAVVGTHKVTVSLMTHLDGRAPTSTEEGMDFEQLRIQGVLIESVPTCFSSAVESTLSCEVQADQRNTRDFELSKS